MTALDVFTIGHSTHALDDLVALLDRHEIERLVDVRLIPASRRFPHFSRESLADALPGSHVEYLHMRELGGRRRPAAGSPNGGWKSAGFRGYADYMGTEAFQASLGELERLAGERRTAIMCAEALWWRCHRRLIADALVAGGHVVRHIAADGRLQEHRLPGFAEVRDGVVTYPPRQPPLPGSTES